MTADTHAVAHTHKHFVVCAGGANSSGCGVHIHDELCQYLNKILSGLK